MSGYLPGFGETTHRPMMATMMALMIFVGGSARGETHAELTQQVQAAETAFAQTMADRDLEAFATFLAEEAIFMDSSQTLRGKDAIIAAWSAFFTGDTASFSWKSASVDVLESGTLAHSSGPVYFPDGREVATFNSIWRREADGSWKVVFDKGCSACP